MNNFITEKNAERPASKKQLWALYCLTKKDYRKQDLTMLDASKLIEQFNASKVVSKMGVNDTPNQVRKTSVKTKKPTLEQEFISYMEEKIQDAHKKPKLGVFGTICFAVGILLTLIFLLLLFIFGEDTFNIEDLMACLGVMAEVSFPPLIIGLLIKRSKKKDFKEGLKLIKPTEKNLAEKKRELEELLRK